MEAETQQVIGQLVSNGVDPFMLAKTLGLPLATIHQTAISFNTGTVITSPEDASIAEEYRRLELQAIRLASNFMKILPPTLAMRLMTPLIRSAGSRIGRTQDAEGEQSTKTALEELYAGMRSLPKAVNQ